MTLTQQFTAPRVAIGEVVPPLMEEMGVETWEPGMSLPESFPGLQRNHPYDQVLQLKNDLIAGLESWKDIYGRLSVAEKKYTLLHTAKAAGGIPDEHESLLSASPFGNHGLEFLALMADAALPFGCRSTPLNIAIYGAGFLSVSDSLQFAVDTGNVPETPRHAGYRAFVSGIEEYLFGNIRGTSYEPREILALFLPNGRQGSLTVYDMDERIKTDLGKPEFIITNFFDAPLGSSAYLGFLQRYRQMVFSGREVFLKGDESQQVTSAQFAFGQEEMAKVRIEQRDFVSDGFPDAGDKFDLSIWLEGAYFFIAPALVGILAGVVERTAMGGFILFDMGVTKDMLDLLGLRPIRIYSTNVFGGGTRRSIILLQKASETPTTNEFTRLFRK